jgi:hypothetical protein
MGLLDRDRDRDDGQDQAVDADTAPTSEASSSGLLEQARRVLAVPRDQLECPECGALLQAGYARDPHTQGHWRGTPAHVCPEDDCDYAQRRRAKGEGER